MTRDVYMIRMAVGGNAGGSEQHKAPDLYMQVRGS
ncbi:hypothetical protein F4559_005366 [Saccharothrix violaceirubra]|uniref:Uncharacterized protein n=1 Tax=Saccharothrix violaceirubra TaxID=413306 RepID=A0A7W7T8N6_9PSEU|nr:hypothetical protein [Saccharothrix violaceirubra]